MLKDDCYSECQENLKGSKLREDEQVQAAFKRRSEAQRLLVLGGGV